jgi:hypothetical protein
MTAEITGTFEMGVPVVFLVDKKWGNDAKNGW